MTLEEFDSAAGAAWALDRDWAKQSEEGWIDEFMDSWIQLYPADVVRLLPFAMRWILDRAIESGEFGFTAEFFIEGVFAIESLNGYTDLDGFRMWGPDRDQSRRALAVIGHATVEQRGVIARWIEALAGLVQSSAVETAVRYWRRVER